MSFGGNVGVYVACIFGSCFSLLKARLDLIVLFNGVDDCKFDRLVFILELCYDNCKLERLVLSFVW